MEQNRALNALEPFLALSKSATSARAAADLITQATSASHTFVFAELLQTPNIQALAQNKEYASHLKLLEIFAWGTWQDYLNAQSTLPPLNEQQTHKLRLLTLLTLLTNSTTTSSTNGTTTNEPLTYSHLQTTLSLASPRALEDLLISAIYSSLLTGSLSPATSTADITSVAALRDLAPGSIPRMASSLDVWQARCDAELQSLEAQIQGIRERSRREARRRRVAAEGFERAMSVVEKEREREKGVGAHHRKERGLLNPYLEQ
ncbi:MAG: hypothetical protein Q9157_008132 [Trypethelium eluteriae]